MRTAALSEDELQTVVQFDDEQLRIYGALVNRDKLAARLWLFLETEHRLGRLRESYPLFATDPAADSPATATHDPEHD